MTVRGKISLLYLATYGTVVISLGLTVFFVLRNLEFRRIDNLLLSFHNDIVNTYKFAGQENRLLNLAGNEDFGFAIYIEDEPVASFRAEPELFRKAEGIGTKGDHRYRATVELIEGTEERFVTFYNLGKSEEYLKFVLAVVVFSSLSILLAVSLIGTIFTRKLIRPFEEAGNQMELISRTGLKDARISLRKSGDEVSKLESEINKALSRIEQLINDAKQFSSRIAHELRTPLAVMKSNLQLSLTGSSSKESMREALRETLEEVEKLIRLSEEYLLLSRTEITVPIEQREIDLSRLVLETTEKIMILHPDKEIEIQILPDIVISASGYMIEHVVMNLLDNACKYSTDDSIKIKLTREEEFSLLSVSNKGKAVDFMSLDESVKGVQAQGYGLGLRVVLSILRAHNLRLDYEHEEGINRFMIEFPSEAYSR